VALALASLLSVDVRAGGGGRGIPGARVQRGTAYWGKRGGQGVQSGRGRRLEGVGGQGGKRGCGKRSGDANAWGLIEQQRWRCGVRLGPSTRYLSSLLCRAPNCRRCTGGPSGVRPPHCTCATPSWQHPLGSWAVHRAPGPQVAPGSKAQKPSCSALLPAALLCSRPWIEPSQAEGSGYQGWRTG